MSAASQFRSALPFEDLTKRMTAAQLRLLGILGREFFSDVIKQLEVALLGILLQSGNKSPGHCSSGLTGNVRVLSVSRVS